MKQKAIIAVVAFVLGATFATGAAALPIDNPNNDEPQPQGNITDVEVQDRQYVVTVDSHAVDDLYVYTSDETPEYAGFGYTIHHAELPVGATVHKFALNWSSKEMRPCGYDTDAPTQIVAFSDGVAVDRTEVNITAQTEMDCELSGADKPEGETDG